MRGPLARYSERTATVAAGAVADAMAPRRRAVAGRIPIMKRQMLTAANVARSWRSVMHAISFPSFTRSRKLNFPPMVRAMRPRAMCGMGAS